MPEYSCPASASDNVVHVLAVDYIERPRHTEVGEIAAHLRKNASARAYWNPTKIVATGDAANFST